MNDAILKVRQRVVLDGVIGELAIACRKLRELRAAGRAVTLDAGERSNAQDIIAELGWWLDYGG